jgi:biopolymer transport protein ExbD
MSRRPSASEDVSINLTPMIDVVFLLVIFFMVGSKFSDAESHIKVDLPQVGAMRSITRTPDSRTVSIRADGTVALDDVAMPLASVTQTLRAQASQYPDLKVAVRGEADMKHQSFMEALHAVEAAGITKLEIATRPMQR